MKNLIVILSVLSLVFFGLTTAQVMAAEEAGPRMAVKPDGKLLFFDQHGNEIKVLKKLEQKKIIELLNRGDIWTFQTITVYTFKPGSDCMVIYSTQYGTFCFWVNCETGAYVKNCN